MVGRGCFVIVQHNGPLCTRSVYGLGSMIEFWFLGTADQPTFQPSNNESLFLLYHGNVPATYHVLHEGKKSLVVEK